MSPTFLVTIVGLVFYNKIMYIIYSNLRLVYIDITNILPTKYPTLPHESAIKVESMKQWAIYETSW